MRYYVVVQAYNTAGEMSEKSAEAIIDIPPSENFSPCSTLTDPASRIRAAV